MDSLFNSELGTGVMKESYQNNPFSNQNRITKSQIQGYVVFKRDISNRHEIKIR